MNHRNSTQENSEHMIMNNIQTPRIHNPRLFRDGIAWLKLFHHKASNIQPPFYGINIWQVKKKNLIKSMSYMLKLASPGLTGNFGDIHFFKSFRHEKSQQYIVVAIFKWNDLPADRPKRAPLSIIPAHFRFIDSIQAYNWTLEKTLCEDLASYRFKIDEKFHS